MASASVLTQTGGTFTDLGYAELYTRTATSGENTLTVPAGGVLEFTLPPRSFAYIENR